MNILAHRGYWLKPEEKNTRGAFERALSLGFGIESDVRDYLGNLVISHDIPGDSAMPLSEFIALLEQYPRVSFALNVKSDGLQLGIKNSRLSQVSDYYCFDMSVPDTLGYKKTLLPYFTRFSDIEPHASLLEDASGVWLDNFSDNDLNTSVLKDFLAKRKRVCMVSPELHGFEYQGYWQCLKEFVQHNPDTAHLLELCTDFPQDAKEYFS